MALTGLVPLALPVAERLEDAMTHSDSNGGGWLTLALVVGFLVALMGANWLVETLAAWRL